MEHATAIIMAGGDSTRMKTDKTQLTVAGKPLVEHVLEQLRPHFTEILISAKTALSYQFPGIEVVPDERPALGPLVGIVSALKTSRHDRNFVQACDIPETDMDLVREMLAAVSGHHAVTPRNPDGSCEPLFAVYDKSVLPIMEEMLARGQRSVHKVFGLCDAAYLDLPDDRKIMNLNTMEDYRAFVEND
jgi:molybdopterin-guanine dinucleotide biosynthesis protein A